MMIYSVEEQTFELDYKEQNAELKIIISQLEDKLERAEEQLKHFQRLLFGQSTEKTRYQIGKLFPETDETDEASSEEASSSDTHEPASKRAPSKKKQTGYREAMATNMEKTEHHHVETNCQCQHCHQTMIDIGERFVRQEIEYIPARCVHHLFYERAYKCTDCSDQKEQAVIQTAQTPKPLFQKSMASPSIVAKLLHDKITLALPYYRQEAEWRRIGLDVSRRTLANWVILASKHYLGQVSKRIKDYLLQADSIHADETTFQILRRSDGKTGQSLSYIWTYCSGVKETIPIVYYQATLTREQIHPQTILENFEGNLTSDGYVAYSHLSPNIICQGCWSHARRKFVDLNGQHRVRNKALKFINKLFKLEKSYAADQLTVQELEQKRHSRSRPLVEEYFEWLESLPEQSNSLQGAIQYSLNQKEKLMAFLFDGRLEATNNRAERYIRQITIVRKNAYFATSELGATALADGLTLIETAKANDLDPLKYLTYLLEKLSQYDQLTNEIIDRYLPWLESTKNALTPIT